MSDTITILIADDEVIERKVLNRKLSRFLVEDGRCRILEAVNGAEALAIWQKEHPEILILDIRMPGLTGLEVAEAVRKQDKDAVIIFLTAFDEFAYARKAITVRALDYLLKPCEETELFAVVEEAVRLAAERKENRQKNAAMAEARVTAGEGGDEEPGSRQQARIRDYIEANYMKDLSIQEMAGQMGYSEVYFCKLFKQYFGQSFVTYLTDFRIREACRLLREEDANVRRIGNAVGYPDANYFTKVFRRIMGVTPSEYRAGK